ncbi:MAG: hypothetical protein ABI343_02150 [Burkholderiaceae bacterium]
MSGSKLFDASSPLPSGHVPTDQPLGLTVHSLPSLGGSPDQVRRTRNGRLKMLLVLLICAAPVIASYVTYYFVRPEGRSVFGELIDPQRPLPDVQAVALDGKTVNLRSLKGQWLLVTVAGGACDKACEGQLYIQRQLRESLGQEMDRVDRVWLIDDDARVAPSLLPALHDATVLRVPQQTLNRWLSPAPGHALADHLYVVDPMGNWMMRFPASLDLAGAAKAKRDLGRLLRASASWDNAGR